MRPALPCVALVAALLTFAGCSDDECTDEDGDGYGVGACTASDCDDTDARHHNDCHSCSDPDDDGRGAGCNLGADCSPSNALHWADCGECADTDRDGRGEACDLGVDCDDADPDHWGTCGSCTDADGDAHFAGCDAYVNRPGPDCDDADPNNHSRCAICADKDGDGRLANCDRYAQDMGPDCDDADINNWSSCGACRDADADGYSTGCDAYNAPLMGPDCNDGSGLHWQDCGTCVDSDGDGYGPGCDLGNDCNNSNRDVWVSCGSCRDNDTDGRWVGCDSYFSNPGPDCNDNDNSVWTSCSTCTDTDTDGYWRQCDTYTQAKPGPDCNDNDPNNYTSCGTCRDNDLDTHYAGCDVYSTINGPDCGDFDRNNWDSCSTCLDTDGDGRFVDCDSYMTIQGPDCAPADGRHWSDCLTCTDPDDDGRGTSCDLGTDCDEVSTNSEFHWADCGMCTDGDTDHYGTNCDLGPDCNDANAAINPQGSDPTTRNNIDENCDGYDGAPLFSDNFDDGFLSPWSSSGDAQLQTTYKASGTHALNLGYFTGNAYSPSFSTTACSAVYWSYRGKRGPDAPEFSDTLVLYYYNGSGYVAIDTWNGSGSVDSGFTKREGYLSAADARYASFFLRFQTPNGSFASDDFFVDDVIVGCAPDADGDHVADPVDCAPNDADHWSDCQTCVDNDTDDYGAGCNLGADCNDFDSAVNPEQTDTTGDGIDNNCDGPDGTVVTATFTTSPFTTIPDGGGDSTGCNATGAISSVIDVTTTGTNWDVDVTLNISHTNLSDIDVYLQYNNGVDAPTCILLTSDNGGFGNNYTNTVFSDEGTTLVTSGFAPFTGTYRPEGALTAIEGITSDATYTLFVNDDAVFTQGTLTSWGLTVRYY